MPNLKLITVLTTALVDSINPCAIGVLILLIGILFSLAYDQRRMLAIGLLYIFVIYVTYFLAGLGLLFFIQKLEIADELGIAVGILVILLGMVDVKDFFWYGRGFSLSIPKKSIAKIKEYARKGSLPSVIFLGFLVAAVELPCTGGPYLAITTLLAKDFSLTALWYLALYNFIFVLPLLVILAIAYGTSRISKIEAWKERYKRWMRLASGLLMIALGGLLILYARGDIVL